MLRIADETSCATPLVVASAIVTLALADAGCRPAETPECRRHSDCSTGEFCRMGVCVPAVDEPETATTGERSHPDGGESTTTTGDGAAEIPPEPCRGADPPTAENTAINEILVDVPSGEAGDTNGDGERSASEDEFVELVNRGTRPVDARGSAIVVDGDSFELHGAESCLRPGGGLVLFGGLADDASPPTFEASGVLVADSTLSLSNAGGSLLWRAENGEELASVEWSDPPAESLTLGPQMTGTTYRPHSKLAEGRLASPGTCPDGDPLPTRCPEARSVSSRDAGASDVTDTDATP